MIIHYTYHPQPNTRLANCLYLVLNCFKNSNDNNLYKFIVRREDCYKNLVDLNIHKYCVDSSFFNRKKQRLNGYYQNSLIDFNYDILMNFIDETISKSGIFKEKTPIDNKIGLHIRCGDFLGKKVGSYYFIDRDIYLNNSCSELCNCSDTIDVFSDNITYCKSHYSDILYKYFRNINFISNSIVDDLISMSFYKYKILWNSTFSYWSGYISDYIFRNDKQNIILVPDFQTSLCNDGRPISLLYNWKKLGCGRL